MTEIEYCIEMSRLFHCLREPVLRSAIQALRLPPRSRGLDVGCGIGMLTMQLAEATGPAGRIIGLDLSSEVVACAVDRTVKEGMADRISFCVGGAASLPFGDECFDWALSVDLVGYAPIEPLPLIEELARVVKPGGSVAIFGWSSERLLPGHPELEARLSMTGPGLAPFARGMKPDSHFLRSLGRLRRAGLEHCAAQTFAGDAHAPLTGDARSAMVALFDMRWPGVEPELGTHEAAEYRRLCLPESPDFILNHQDYHAFFTYTAYSGKVPGGP